MRDIKFRVWDLEKKFWVENNGTTYTSEVPTDGVIALILTGNLRVFSAKDMGELGLSVSHSEYESIHPCHTAPPYKRQYALMQYTGEKDRNGKEIYEEDIIRVFDKEEDANFNVYVRECVVRYENAMFNTKPVIGSKQGDYYISVGTLEDEELECEVLGNIYENSELL